MSPPIALSDSDELDREDIQRARSGDRRALSRVMRRAIPGLELAARALLGEQMRAKIRTSDLIQSACTEAIHSLPDFRGATEAEFLHWMRRILENNLRDQRKFFSAQKRNMERERRTTDPTRPLVDRGPTPSGQAAFGEDLELVTAAMRRLPRDQVRILLMFGTRGLTHEQVARRLGRTEGACRTLLSRARANLVMEVARLRQQRDADG